MALKVTDDPEHKGLLPELIAIDTVAGAFELTVIVMAELVTVEGLGQTALEIITQVTLELFDKLVLEKLELFVPTFVPFTFH